MTVLFSIAITAIGSNAVMGGFIIYKAARTGLIVIALYWNYIRDEVVIFSSRLLSHIMQKFVLKVIVHEYEARYTKRHCETEFAIIASEATRNPICSHVWDLK